MNYINNFSVKQTNSIVMDVIKNINPVRKLNNINYTYTNGQTVSGEAISNGIFTLDCTTSVTLPTVEELANSSLFISSPPQLYNYINFSIRSLHSCSVVNPYDLGSPVAIVGSDVVKKFNLLFNPNPSTGNLEYVLFGNEL